MKGFTNSITNKIISNQHNTTVGLTIVFLAVFLVFMPTFDNKLLTGWDDQWQVVNNFTSGGFTWNNLKQIFTRSYGTQYSPLNQCFYILIYLVDGYNPMIFHAASLLIHFMNCCLAYYILRVLLLNTNQKQIRQITWIAFLTILLFAIHPLQVESVAWMSASKVLLYTFFYLGATWTFIKYLKKKKLVYYLLTLLFFVCAYGCKEQAVIFPVWATLLCIFFRCDFKSKHVWIMLLFVYVAAVVLGLVFIYGISSYAHVRPGTMMPEYSWWQRIVFLCYSIVEYILKWFVPLNLRHLYYYPMDIGGPLPEWMIMYPLFLIVATCLLWNKIKHWVVLAGALFFLIHIAFVLHLFPVIRPNIIADRYLYLSSIGLSFIAVYFFVMAYEKWKKWIQYTANILVITFFVVLGIYTFKRTQLWHDTKSLKKELMPPEINIKNNQ